MQAEELMTLESIWPDELQVTRMATDIRLIMPVHPDLGGSVEATVHPCKASTSRMTLDYLPPISLRIRIPPEYPLDHPPDVKILWPWLGGCSATWRSDVEADLMRLWQPGEACIYAFIDHLQHVLDSSLDSLHLYEPPFASARSPAPFETRLATYNTMRKTSTFQEGSYRCQICLEERKGKACVTLEACQHLFCFSCLEMMFNIAIAEGNLDAIACPDARCAKRAHDSATADNAVAATIAPHEIQRVVPESAYRRYLWLVDKRRLDADPTASYCPRCNTGAVAAAEEDYASLRECPSCTYAWCALCRRLYHGVAPCPITSRNTVATAYLQGSEAEKAALIKRYGRQVVALALKMQAEIEDELLFEEYKRKNSTACPECRVPVERSDGCAKMVCTKCLTPFCYNCGKYLSKVTPYSHYNDRKSPCFQKLFENIIRPEPALEGDEVWQPQWDPWR